MKVLLVDDEPRFLVSMSKLLRKQDYNITTAQSGAEALKIMEKQRFDAVVVDVKMPGMNGIEFTRKIKSLFPLTEVVFLTAHATLDLAIEGIRLGAFEFLLKPCSVEQLIDKLKLVQEKIGLRKAKIREMEKLRNSKDKSRR